MSSSININHSTTSITTSVGSCIELSKNGVVKIGKGINVIDTTNNIKDATPLDEYEGALRYNESKSCIEYCDGKQWIELSSTPIDDQTQMVYSVLF